MKIRKMIKKAQGHFLALLVGILIMLVASRAMLPAQAAQAPTPAVKSEVLEEWEAMFEAPARSAEAEAMARVVYGTALYNSEAAQQAVMWCIINRVESSLYPSTVIDVCNQPGQWMGYSETNPVLDRLYEMAEDVLEAWNNGGARNLPKDCLWFDWSSREITFRTAFDGACNTWVVG